MQNIAQIDVASIDQEIKILEQEISDLQGLISLKKHSLEIKMEVKKYIESNSLKANNSNKNVIIPPGAGLTEFILAYLERGRTDTSLIIKAYADYTKADYNDVANNISNALNRLRGAGKVGSEANEGGRKAGSKWFLVNQ
jgi:hypothetical protein